MDWTGVYLVSRAVVSVMCLQGGGRIISIASVAGLVPRHLQSAFVAAQAAVINLTRTMAIELGGDGILVNAIAPGSILTEGTRRLLSGQDAKFRDSVERLLAHIPLRRPGRPEEVAAAVLFLVTPQAGYVNGAVLTVDGGWTAGYARHSLVGRTRRVRTGDREHGRRDAGGAHCDFAAESMGSHEYSEKIGRQKGAGDGHGHGHWA